MLGTFVCFDNAGKVDVVRSGKMGLLRGHPMLTDISESFRYAQKAERVLFVGDDGSVWLMKDRFTKEGKVLHAVGEQPPFEIKIDI